MSIMTPSRSVFLLYRLLFVQCRASRTRELLQASMLTLSSERRSFLQSVDRFFVTTRDGDEGLLRELLDKSPPVVVNTPLGKRGRAAVHVAALRGHTDCLRLLLDAGADPTSREKNGRTPLHLAAAAGHADCVKLLLNRGMRADLIDMTERTALHDAAGYGSLESLWALLDKGGDIDAQDADLATPLHLAAKWGHADCVEALLEARARVDEIDEDGRTALHVATAMEQLECMTLLLEANADVDAEDIDMRMPLDLAIESGSDIAFAAKLLAFGAEVPPNTRVHPSVRVLAHARAVDRLTSLHTSEVTAAVSRMSDALNERLEPRALPEGDAERSHARLGVLLDTAGERAVRRRALEQQSAAAGIKGRPPSAVTTLAGAVLLRHCAEEAERDAARRCVALLEELFSLSRSGGGESSGSTGPEAKAEPQQPIAGAACEAGCAAAIAAAATASVKAVTVGCSPGETSVSAAEEQDGQGSNESRLRSRRARLDLFASAVCVGKWGRAIQAREASAAAERAARLALDSTRALAELFAERLATAGELKRLSRRAQGMGPELWVVGDGAGDDDGTSSENGGYPM